MIDNAASHIDDEHGRPTWNKKRPKAFFLNFRHAFNGLYVAFWEEPSFRAEVYCFIATLIVGKWWAHPDKLGWFGILTGYALIFAFELSNTSHENHLRKGEPGRHRLVRNSYDTAAAAVAVSIGYTIIAIVLAFTHIW